MISLPNQHYRISHCLVNCHDMTISNDKETIQLPAKVFEFLKLLILNAGQTVTKEEAIEQVWQNNIEVGKRGAGNAIWHLRKAFTEIGFDQDEVFKTITKIGYQLIIQPEAIAENKIAIATHDKKPKNIKAIFISLSLIVFTIVVIWQFSYTPTSPNKARQHISTKATNFEGVEEQAAISPDGKYMAFQWKRENKQSQLYIKNLVEKDAPLRLLSLSSDKEVAPTWSPDSKSIAYYRISKQGICSLHVKELSTKQDQTINTDCSTEGYLTNLAWSPDGTKLAFTKSKADSMAIFLYHFTTKEISQYTFPQGRERDLLMSWDNNSDNMIFVRTVEMHSQLFSTNKQGIKKIIAPKGAMILGLAWNKQDNQLYFNAMKDGGFEVKKLDLATGEQQSILTDNGLYSLSINPITQELFYSRHIAQEYITIRSLDNEKITKRIASSSRNLYGQHVENTDEVLFLSNRNGAWELWLKQDSGSTQITFDQGQITIPSVSPIDNSFLVAIKTNDQEYYRLYRGLLPDAKPQEFLAVDGDIRNPTYAPDGQSIYFSSNLSGKWAIHRYDFATKTIKQITKDNGKYAIATPSGDIFYTKDNISALFILPKGETKSRKLPIKLSESDWGNFFFKDNQLFYLKRTKTNDELIRIDQQGNEHIVFSLPAVSIRSAKSLSPASNNTVIVSMQGINDADIHSTSLHE